MLNVDLEKILVLDFGSQTTQLIARRLREIGVYCEVQSCEIPLNEIRKMNLKGIILSGSPYNLHNNDAPMIDLGIFEIGIPILGICYGMQVVVHLLGGSISKDKKSEYGFSKIKIVNSIGPFSSFGLDKEEKVWMSHSNSVKDLPDDFEVIAFSSNNSVAAVYNKKFSFWGLQFHPEVSHTLHGLEMLLSFVKKTCGCVLKWSMNNFIKDTIKNLKKRIVGQKVICALSGGVDSSVVALLLYKAIGLNLIAVFVDNGMLRLNDKEKTLFFFKKLLGTNLVMLDASSKFLGNLKDVVNPEEKRKIIGHTFIDLFEEQALKFGDINFLAQGTLYPDIVESKKQGFTSTIKNHHNVGGLPEKMKLKLIEPLSKLFKDECRKVGKELGLPDEILYRHPFPGPGMGIRIIGKITRERINVLRKADYILEKIIREAGLYNEIWQSFAVLLPIKTVGILGDKGTYGETIAIRAVNSVDAMTADWFRIPHEILAKISHEIMNKVRGINRVVYDISTKPPATIEWE